MSVSEVMKNNERMALHGQQCARNTAEGAEEEEMEVSVEATYCTHMVQPL